MNLDFAVLRADPDTAEATCRRELQAYQIPDSLHGGLVRYLVDGIRPGSFLCAVLENDLLEAVTRANPPENFEALPALVRFLFNEAPATSYGSAEKVAIWCATRRQTGP